MSRRKVRDLFDLRIEKSNLGRGYYFNKAPGIKCTMTKQIAMRDITEECGRNKIFRQNYVPNEALVLFLCKFDGLEL